MLLPNKHACTASLIAQLQDTSFATYIKGERGLELLYLFVLDGAQWTEPIHIRQKSTEPADLSGNG